MTDLQLPDGLYALTTKKALEVLGISRSTLGDFKACLNHEQPDGWDYLEGQRGLTVTQLQILWLLKQLVQRLGRPAAQNNIHNAIKETINHG